MSAQGRCPTHDIALSPAGDCVVCRRTSPPRQAPAREEPSPWTRALGGMAIVAVAAVVTVSALVDTLRGARGPERIEGGFEAAAPPGGVLDGARRRVPITMYSTSWCGACRLARRYFDERGIAYRDHDVERDRGAAMRMRELNPRGSVPTIDIDGRVLVGFSARAIEAAIDDAAQRRL